jgi:hypothetical protein
MNVCVLSDHEAERLREGKKVFCREHEHIKAQEAWDEVAPAWMRSNPSHNLPLAKWVGPRQIVRMRSFHWKKVSASKGADGANLRIATQQLRPGSPPLAKNRAR